MFKTLDKIITFFGLLLCTTSLFIGMIALPILFWYSITKDFKRVKIWK